MARGSQPIPQETRDLVVSMIRNGHGRNAVARVAGISAGSVTNIANDEGLSFDRKATEQATKNRKVELAEKRSLLEAQLLEDAAQLRRQLFAETTYHQAVGGAEPRVMRWTLPRPVPADQYKIVQAATLAITQSQRIADSAADQGTEAAKSMLAQLGEALGAAWRGIQATDTEEV